MGAGENAGVLMCSGGEVQNVGNINGQHIEFFDTFYFYKYNFVVCTSKQTT